MTFFEIGLEDDELEALRKCMAAAGQQMTETWALKTLIRDALIGAGYLESPSQAEARQAIAH